MMSEVIHHRGRILAVAAALAGTFVGSPAVQADETNPPANVLKVCSDPDNMPFSNARLEGFENRIADVLAADLGLTVDYTWGAQYRGFLRKTLQSGDCDVVIGIPAGFPRVATTRPYFRSAWVFLWAPARMREPTSFDDVALREAKIGLHALGMEGANSPPAMSLTHRSLGGNVTGFSVWGDGSTPNPQGRLIEAVAQGAVDVAIVWGPTAGYFARPFGTALAMAPILADPNLPDVPFAYDIAVGTRKDDTALRDRLQGALDRQEDRIHAILTEFGVPQLGLPVRKSGG